MNHAAAHHAENLRMMIQGSDDEYDQALKNAIKFLEGLAYPDQHNVIQGYLHMVEDAEGVLQYIGFKGGMTKDYQKAAVYSEPDEYNVAINGLNKLLPTIQSTKKICEKILGKFGKFALVYEEGRVLVITKERYSCDWIDKQFEEFDVQYADSKSFYFYHQMEE